MLAELAFYGSLAGAAVYATWHDEELRWIGLALVLSFLLSNLVWANGTQQDRAGVYTMTEIVVLAAAGQAWRKEGRWALVALVAVCVLSICANIAYASVPPSDRTGDLHKTITNATFFLECLLVAGLGVADGIRSGRFRHWSADSGRNPEAYVRRDVEP